MKNFRLDDRRISDGFTAPDRYFEEFKVEPRTGPEVLPIYQVRHWAAAAAILVLGLAIPALNRLQNVHPSSDAIENYLVMGTLNEEELVKQLDHADLKVLSAEYHLDNSVAEKAILDEDFENLIY